MSRVLLSAAVRQDRRAITEYTVKRFGVQQARRLRDRFETLLNALAESPLIGRNREELDPPGHTSRYLVAMKSFVIVYEPAEDGIRIVRLLHGARDLAAELESDAGNVE